MKKINQYLLEHIELNKQMIFEIMGILKESHGYNSDIARFIRYNIQPYIQQSPEYKRFDKGETLQEIWHIKSNDIKELPWINSLDVRITWINSKESFYKGGYKPNGAIVDGQGINVVISVNIFGIGGYFMLEDTLAAIAHELLHAYEDYRRRINGYKGLGEMTLYMPYAGFQKNYDRNDLAKLLYRLVSFERNAFLSELYIALIDKSDSYKKEDLLKAVKETRIYKLYIETANMVSKLKSISTTEDKQKVVESYNKIVESENEIGRKFPKATSFKQILDYVWRQWRKFDKKWKQNINKVIYDILTEHLLYIR